MMDVVLFVVFSIVFLLVCFSFGFLSGIIYFRARSKLIFALIFVIFASFHYLLHAFINLDLYSLSLFASVFWISMFIGSKCQAIGLTGGISCGKSSVSAVFSELNIPIIDADKVARQIVEPGQSAYKQIVRKFGAGILHSDESINREKLGKLIFSDPEKRKLLNSCTHKYIILEMLRQLMYYRLVKNHSLVIMDAPLLYESGVLTYVCYPIIVVACSEAIQVKRLQHRDNLTADQALERINSQMPLHVKVQKADVTIDNSGSKNALREKAIYELKKAAAMIGLAFDG